MNLTSDLMELSFQLQQEHLFVTTEKESLQRLFHNVSLLSERIFHTAWIARQQKLNLQEFIDKGNHAGSAVEAYSVSNQLEDTNFIDSYKVFSYHDTKYGELLKYLYENPNLLSSAIITAENIGGLQVKKMIAMTVTSVYGNCLFHEDEQNVLRLLKNLLDTQVANSDNPRRLIRRENMSFSLVYKHLCDSLFSARLFLTAALYDPIMRLLMEDEWFFDIDPDKALVRFPPAEKIRRFGEPGTEENKKKLTQYRSFIVDKLVLLAERFIKSIKANIHCFPASLGWLVSQVYRVLIERGQVDMQEVRASCADLVFALFICPAICDPEPHGITSDVPISHIARHNLMQMAQIIQILAISTPDDIDPKTRDLYSRFDKGCMASVLDTFLEGPWEDLTEQIACSPSSASSTSSSSVSSSTPSSQGASRSAVLLTATDIREMLNFLRNTCSRLDEKTHGKKHLEQLLSSLPIDMPPSSTDNLSIPGGSGVITPATMSGPAFSGEPSGTLGADKKLLFKSKGQKKKQRSGSVLPQEEMTSAVVEPSEPETTDVLVVSIYPTSDCPGMIAEKKVLSSTENEAKKPQNHVTPTPSTTATAAAAASTSAPHPEIQEKRTRFSLSHDQESIGNASDYQEVISEAASSHSVEDEENELETDNFSDMMSANVSGRGSPSISGRDTPLSQAGSVEENHPPAAQLPVPVPETVRKQNRVDVTDRFGKFEIKPELGMERDECKSTVSDTWSTDVLASDSEPPEQNQSDRLEEVAEEIIRPLLLGSEPISEISETASNWSTDVLAASDTDEKHSELLKDLELDLTCAAQERDEADSSLGHDDGEDNSMDLDALGAIGGHAAASSGDNQGDLNEPFPDVFLEPLTKNNSSFGEKANNAKKQSNVMFNFQSGPNLQLPSSHKNSQMKHSESRGNSSSPTIEGSMSHSLLPSCPTTVHSSTGARSKVREKEDRVRGHKQRSSHSGGGEDVSSGLEFDPLSSRSGKLGKEKWGRGHKQGAVDLPYQDLLSGGSAGMTSSNVYPELPPSRGQHRSGSRDSGIDIWVKTNGQVSGNSSRSQTLSAALIGARSSLDSSISPPRYNTSTPGRASLDSNIQRIQSLAHTHGGPGGMTSTPDSGLHSLSYMSSVANSSMDSNTPPLELDNPLFSFTSSTETLETGPKDIPQNTLFSAESFETTLPYDKDSGNYEPLVQIDSTDSNNLPEKVHKRHNRKLRRSMPQIEVSDSYATMSILEDDKEEGSDAEENLAQQQVSNVDERRLSSAFKRLNTFSLEDDEPPLPVMPSSSSSHFSTEFPPGSLPDATSLINTSDTSDMDSSMKVNCSGNSSFNDSLILLEDTKRADSEVKTHHRQDSSGSSQSANSFKLNLSAKDASGDNISIHSTDSKELVEGDESGIKNKKSSTPGFFRSFFKGGIKKKNLKLERDSSADMTDMDPAYTTRTNTQTLPVREPTVTALSSSESTDDILAKYRSPKRLPAGKPGNNNSSSTVNNNTGDTTEKLVDIGPVDSGNSGASRASAIVGNLPSSASGAAPSSIMSRGGSLSDSHLLHDLNGRPFFDRDDLEGCPAFEDAKRKLRMVLSTGDVYIGLNQVQSSSPREGVSARENELLNLLQAQMAEAINLQNKDVVAQLYEVIRCVKMFDIDGCKKLLRSMQEDYRRRSVYISYLVRCRQGLLATRSQLQRLLNRVNRDKEICSKHLTNVCARHFLDRRERRMFKFITEFQKLTVSDEKIDQVEHFLQQLYQEMSTDALWKAATDSQLEDGQQAVERFLMSRIYTHAMFPNGDGDISRDQVLQEHLYKLGKVISPTHKDLRIPPVYHAECPWLAAQKEIYMINAYKTPKDKIQCVLRCSQTIMNLLSMANEKSVPAADDFMPVLIFVIIKANPFGLLSTIQYVNSFYDSRLHGEEQYWWLQLTSAVEFIKTMDYSTC